MDKLKYQAQREAYRPSLTKVVFYSASVEVRYIVILLSLMPSQVKFVNGAVLMCYWCKYITSTRNHYFWFNILERSKFPVTVIDMKNKCIGLAHWRYTPNRLSQCSHNITVKLLALLEHCNKVTLTLHWVAWSLRSLCHPNIASSMWTILDHHPSIETIKRSQRPALLATFKKKSKQEKIIRKFLCVSLIKMKGSPFIQ